MYKFFRRVQKHAGISQRQCQISANFLFCLPLPATASNYTGHSGLIPSDEERIFLVRTRNLFPGGSSSMRVFLGELAPPHPSYGLSGLALPARFFKPSQTRPPNEG